MKDAEICSVGQIAESARFAGEEGLSLQSAVTLAERQRAMTVKRIGVLVECSGAERRQNDNLLIPYAH